MYDGTLNMYVCMYVCMYVYGDGSVIMYVFNHSVYVFNDDSVNILYMMIAV